MGFMRERKRYITVDEMNEHLKYVKKCFALVYRAKEPDELMLRKAFIEDCQVNFYLTYKRASTTCTYICRKDGLETKQRIDGGEAFRILNMYYHVPRMPERICGKAIEGGLSASPLLWYNPTYNKTRQKAICYDMNSAYSYAMLQDMPDTSVPWRSGKIVEGKEIGFREALNPNNEETTCLETRYSGHSQWIFPLMRSPFEKFVKQWYNEKLNGDKDKAKCVLNYSVGSLQRVNPFLRATIICNCNNLIKSMIDESTLFCNTDSITTMKKLDLKFGKAVGEWKVEHEGEVAYVGNNYQWSDGSTSYRGIPKQWFKKGWDILKDPVPTKGNIYRFDEKKVRLV